MFFVENNLTLKDLRSEIEKRFSVIYPSVSLKDPTNEGRIIFYNLDNSLFSVDMIPSLGCLVIEYSENTESLPLEDGDLFYPEDYNDIEELFKAMHNEVK